MRKIIIEGPDCAGKTTYAKNLAGSDLSLIHYGIHGELQAVDQFKLFRSYMDLPAPIVFDRSPISECIYSKYRKAVPWFTYSDVFKLIKEEYGECNICFILPNPKIITRLCSLTDQPIFVRDNIVSILNEYRLIASYFGDRSNVSIFDTSDQLIEAIIELEKRRDFDHRFRDPANSAVSRLYTETGGSSDKGK